MNFGNYIKTLEQGDFLALGTLDHFRHFKLVRL
jgi:hypothetical protein